MLLKLCISKIMSHACFCVLFPQLSFMFAEFILIHICRGSPLICLVTIMFWLHNDLDMRTSMDLCVVFRLVTTPQVFESIFPGVSSGTHFRMDLLDHSMILLMYQLAPICFPIWLYELAFPPALSENCHSSTSSPIQDHINLFKPFNQKSIYM